MIRPLHSAVVSFELGEEIGQEGKNSQVFKARDIQLDAQLVVKKIKKSKFDNVDNFFREASILYLSSHPNIVPIHYGCQDKEYIYLAMPLYVQGSLKKLLNCRFLTVREIIIFSTQILSALHNIHSKGLIHFDVKPDNVLLSDRCEALLSDFGLAKQTSYSGIAQQDRIYPSMVPPEAFGTDKFTSSFDIYQAGLTIYRMCVGEDEFQKDFNNYIKDGMLERDSFSHAVKNGQFPAKNSYPEHIPLKLINTINSCLVVDPSDRYSAAIDVVNDLAGIDGELLDWAFEKNNGSNRWTKRSECGKIYTLVVKSDGESVATKTFADDKIQNIRKYCVKKIGRAKTKSFLKEH